MRYLRYFLTILILVVAFFIIYPKFKEVYYNIPALLGAANKPLLFLLIAFQIINYFGDGLLSQTLLNIANVRVKLEDNLKIAVLGVVGNHVAPFIGGTLITFLAYKKLKIPSAITSFLIFSWAFFIWLVYISFFILSLILLPSLVFKFISLKSILIVIFSLVFLIFLFFVVFKGKKLISKSINSFYQKFSSKTEIIKKFISDFRQSLHYLRNNKNKIPKLLFSAFLFYIGDVLTLYFSFMVFGFKPQPILLIFGYTISLVLTAFTFMPGAPGVMEVSLILVFIKLNFPPHIVLFSSLLFRIFTYWLPLPFGTIFYFRLKKEEEPALN